MREFVVLSIAAVLSGSGSAAFADMDLLKKNNCLACHAVDQKIFGPQLKDVAAKYRGDAGAQKFLSKKIRAGGSGVWGESPMPPQPQVTEAEAQALAKYVLSLK